MTRPQPAPSGWRIPDRLRAAALALGLGLGAPLVLAAPEGGQDYSAHEVPPTQHQRVSPRYVVDPSRPVWPGAVVAYHYNPSGQPARLDTGAVLQAIQTAARKWENLCNVRFVYRGLHTAQPDVGGGYGSVDHLNVIGWRQLTGSQANVGGYVAWWWSQGALVDADMVLNTAYGDQLARNPGELESLLTHEMGHMLAIEHSDTPQSVMFANPYHSSAFQTTLRGDDAAACASLYGASSQAPANRIFNWAEQSFAQFVAPAGGTSQDLADYHYRFYARTGNYLAVQNGQVLFLQADGTLSRLGSVQELLPAAAAAGF